jgi:type II secretory pathway pseudopilin PulG
MQSNSVSGKTGDRRQETISSRFRSNASGLSAFTLLEVLLASTVLVAGTAAVLQTAAAVRRNAVRAEELARIQNACLSAMNLYVASSAPLPAEAELPIYNVPDEHITVRTYPSPHTGLSVLQLTVGTKYRLMRLVVVADGG